MTFRRPNTRRPPRLVVRTLVATFAAIAAVLSATFLTLVVETRARVIREVASNLDASQHAFAGLERRRQTEEHLQASALAESPTLKAALDTYQAELRRPDAGASPDLIATVQHELQKLSNHVLADAVVVTDERGRVVASAGPGSEAWAQGRQLDVALGGAREGELVVNTPSAAFRIVTVPLVAAGETIGSLLLATMIDDAYVRELSAVSRTQAAVVVDGRVIASTLDPARRAALDAIGSTLPEQGIVTLNGDAQAVQLLFKSGIARFYAVDSINLAAANATQSAVEALVVIALGALALGGVVSLWLARTVAQPIDQLSQQLRAMAGAHDFSQTLPRPETSLELNALADTFNELMSSLVMAEEATEAAYLAAIKGLAAALDARDPYTSGHSERVSALSVMVGREMRLADGDIEVLRLGALLHDIGKIGIRDKVLSKVGPLTDEEFEIIKTHPTVGAHILRQVPFLSKHLPIVELHHEQPDGRGYPYGLLGHATPLVARIVHVADAFDAMTSARAYRPAQAEAHALGEFRRHRDTQFDGQVVDAFLSAWRSNTTSDVASIQAGVRAARGPIAIEAGGAR